MSKLLDILTEINTCVEEIEKAWQKKPIGSVVTRSNGKRYAKVAETGNADQDWVLESQAKSGVAKPEEAAKEHKHSPAELGKHAKSTSEEALKAAISASDDPAIRSAAHKELDRRSKEEAVQEKEEQQKEEPVKSDFDKKPDKEYSKDLRVLKNRVEQFLMATEEGDFSASQKTRKSIDEFMVNKKEMLSDEFIKFYDKLLGKDRQLDSEKLDEFAKYVKKNESKLFKPSEEEDKTVKKGFESWL